MSSLFPPAPTPATKLGRYRQLAPRAAVHVSPLALGGMSIGDKWAKIGMGAMDKESSFKLLDAYFDAGGNHIDTANEYQHGSSEEFIGEWAETRGYRDQLVIATKISEYTSQGRGHDDTIKQKTSFMGNNAKSLKLSVDLSLERLRTTYIDILYVHWWDLHTSVEEIMDSLHHLVVAGKVLYLGISDSPAWFIVKANDYAKANGKTPFAVCQVPYSVLRRDIEREILPMCKHEGSSQLGIALVLFWTLAGGKIRTDAEEEKRRTTGEGGRTMMGPWERTEDEKKMCTALEVVAKQVGTKHITAVAIAYTMHKAPFVFPIIGGRKPEQLLANIEALDITLSREQIAYIEGVLPFDRGFPNGLLGEYGHGTYPFLMTTYAAFDPQPVLPPVLPAAQQREANTTAVSGEHS
ncbi:aryl-alcohol dehydrogenase [Mycena maculata]|uniref:Aryl-alcohol dehydrogenase n=1 Tax=Mycena maculata TaxID=230809 RepID=A0AAD7HCF2_9AGAR|nr:aryl-alcohol dehydrogenase [Mycena maculata]